MTVVSTSAILVRIRSFHRPLSPFLKSSYHNADARGGPPVRFVLFSLDGGVGEDRRITPFVKPHGQT